MAHTLFYRLTTLLGTIAFLTSMYSCKKCEDGDYSTVFTLCEISDVPVNEIISLSLDKHIAVADDITIVTAKVTIPPNVKDAYRDVKFTTNFGTILGATTDKPREKIITLNGTGIDSVKIRVGTQAGYYFTVTCEYVDTKLKNYKATDTLTLVQPNSQFCLSLQQNNTPSGSCPTTFGGNYEADGFSTYYFIAHLTNLPQQRVSQKIELKLSHTNAGTLETSSGSINITRNLNPNENDVTIPYFLGIQTGNYTATATLKNSQNETLEYHLWDIHLIPPSGSPIDLTIEYDAGAPLSADGISGFTLIAQTNPASNINNDRKVKFKLPISLGKFDDGSQEKEVLVLGDGKAQIHGKVSVSPGSYIASASFVQNGLTFEDYTPVVTRQLYTAEVISISTTPTGPYKADGISQAVFTMSLHDTPNNKVKIQAVSGSLLNVTDPNNVTVSGSIPITFKLSNRIEPQGIRITLINQETIDSVYYLNIIDTAYATQQMVIQPSTYYFSSEGNNIDIDIQLLRPPGKVTQSVPVWIEGIPFQINSNNDTIPAGNILNPSALITNANGEISDVHFQPFTPNQGLEPDLPIKIIFKTKKDPFIGTEPWSYILTLYPQ